MATHDSEYASSARLQQIVADTASLFLEGMPGKARKEKKRTPAIADEQGALLPATLERECRLAALVLLLKKTIELYAAPDAVQQAAHAYKMLPASFRKFAESFSPVVEEKVSLQVFRMLEKILRHPADIIGQVYNTFLHNGYQQSHGQHFTQTTEADMLSAFCIRSHTFSLMDGSCGSGIFLKRGYYFFQHHHATNGEARLAISGVDISPFATFLTMANFAFLPVRPVLYTRNFMKMQAAIPPASADACTGNPPYIRHEAQKDKEAWRKLLREQHSISYIGGQSDLYSYFLVHAVSFLKEKGRLGWVLAASWLDSRYGAGLQQFLLEHCKIIAIIDQQAKRSFHTASVNTVLLVIEKCAGEEERRNHCVKFVRLHHPYEKIIGEGDTEQRIRKSIRFAKEIEAMQESTLAKGWQVEVVRQDSLWQQGISGGKYQNGYWGAAYLRSPQILHKMTAFRDRLVTIEEVAEIKYGIKTGANDFFYLEDKTAAARALDEDAYKRTFGKEKQRHLSFWDTHGWYLSALNDTCYVIERIFVRPVFKSQKEAVHLSVDTHNLRFVVLNCSLPEKILLKEKRAITDYIRVAESLGIHKRPSVAGRSPWYNLTGSFVKGDFIFPAKIGERYRLADNRKAGVVCDKVSYAVCIREQWKGYAGELFLLMNSIWFRYLIDLFSRQLTGSQTLSDVDVNVLKKTQIPSPVLFRKACRHTGKLIHSLQSREQLPVAEEIKQPDKMAVDLAIGRVMGLDKAAVQALYKEAALYVEKRKEKSDSLK